MTRTAAIGVILVSMFSCWGHQKAREIKYEFFYRRFIDGFRGQYEKHIYSIEDDRIIELMQTLDTLGNNLGDEQRTLYRTERGLDILVKGKKIPYLIFEPEYCEKYMHAMGFVVQTCFKSMINYKGHKSVIEYTEEPLTLDGVRQTIHLDSNFCLIDKLSERPEVYDSLVRVPRPPHFE